MYGVHCMMQLTKDIGPGCQQTPSVLHREYLVRPRPQNFTAVAPDKDAANHYFISGIQRGFIMYGSTDGSWMIACMQPPRG